MIADKRRVYRVRHARVLNFNGMSYWRERMWIGEVKVHFLCFSWFFPVGAWRWTKQDAVRDTLLHDELHSPLEEPETYRASDKRG